MDQRLPRDMKASSNGDLCGRLLWMQAIQVMYHDVLLTEQIVVTCKLWHGRLTKGNRIGTFRIPAMRQTMQKQVLEYPQQILPAIVNFQSVPASACFSFEHLDPASELYVHPERQLTESFWAVPGYGFTSPNVSSSGHPPMGFLE
jgi:hypothetical protein